MTNRIFYDSIDATKIPKDAVGVMGYDNGPISQWHPGWWNLFPRAVRVHISVFASANTGTVLDVEHGDATPAQSVDWVLMRRKAGVDPTVYMNMSTWPAVRAAFKARKVQEPHYWVAQYDNVQEIPAGAIGKQYYNNDFLGYDLSVIAPYWPGVDTAPATVMPEWPGYLFQYKPGAVTKFDAHVQTWQLQMRRRGWNIQADGLYGPRSADTCLAFQQDSTAHGWPLSEDGIVGEHTWGATWRRPVSK